MSIKCRFSLVLLVFAIASSPAYANETKGSSAKSETKWFSLAVGGKFLSNIVRRGATFYDAWQILPIVYLGVWDDRIQLLPGSLEFRDSVFDGKLRLRTKFELVGDDPLYITGKAKGIQNSRDSAIEWTNTVEWFYWDHAELNFLVSQGLVEHSGTYFELKPRFYLAGLIPDWDGKVFFRPEVFFALGAGTASHNQFYYGSSASEFGLTHYDIGLLVTIPARYETIFPVLEFKRYQVIGDARRGELLDGQTFGYQFSLTAAIGLL